MPIITNIRVGGGTITVPTTIHPSGITATALELDADGTALNYQKILKARNATKEVFSVDTAGDFILHTDSAASGALFVFTDDLSTTLPNCGIGGGNGIEFTTLSNGDFFVIATAPDGITPTEVMQILGTRKLGFFDQAVGAAPVSQQALPAAAGLQDIQTLLRNYGLITSANATVNALTPKGIITSGALPTAALVSGTAAQLSTTRDVESHTAVTFNPGVATTATCTVALSPDNSTFSTLCVVTKPVGTVFDGTIEDVVVRVPAGWYVKITVVNATLGTTTYY